MTALLEHVSAATGQEVTNLSLRQARAHFERSYLIGLLILHRGNVSRAFEASGMGDRSSFYRKMRAVGITTGEIMRIRREARGGIAQERRQRAPCVANYDVSGGVGAQSEEGDTRAGHGLSETGGER